MADSSKAEGSSPNKASPRVRRSSGRPRGGEDSLRAGDLCRDRGRLAEALGLYAEVRAYDRILALDLSPVLFEKTGGTPFFRIALDIAEHCPEEIRREHPLAMLCVAWALKVAGLDAAFGKVLDDLDERLEESGPLRAEWLLVSAYRHFPRAAEMLPNIREASALFNGACSQVILPEAPWCSGDYCQLAEFHLRPGEADREAEALEEFIPLYSRLTGGHGSGADALFRAEVAYHRGDMATAEIYAYKAAFLAESSRQSVILLGTAKVLADIALLKADAEGWRRAVKAMDRAASSPGQTAWVVRMALDTVRGAILAELQQQSRIAGWLKDGDFSSLPLFPPMRNNALYAHVVYLLNQGEITRFIGTLEAIPEEVARKTAFSEFLFLLFMALGYSLLGKRGQAADFLERAAEKALPDGFVLSLAVCSIQTLQGLTEELIKKRYPTHLEAFITARARYGTGWEALRHAVARGVLPADLTARECEVALLAAEGLRNSEIAERLLVTENTVRAHLRTIFHKLDIDRRAKLK
ncbi:LuxR C-terminal-related transcriptional regulator [Desulfovibrio sp.]|uniref:LuxR C-terminal-related transcriptional regulator n=1 Tax=Desulfovibrio sp. TaxID=885 RepID=UPI003D107DDA